MSIPHQKNISSTNALISSLEYAILSMDTVQKYADNPELKYNIKLAKVDIHDLLMKTKGKQTTKPK